MIIVASAEEESSGQNGLSSVLPLLPKIDFAIVGEPTLMQLAIAEKGLLVLDCYAHGKAGHAAHGLGDNAIYKAIEGIKWIKTFQFPKESETLGKVKMTVTQINAGSLIMALLWRIPQMRNPSCIPLFTHIRPDSDHLAAISN